MSSASAMDHAALRRLVPAWIAGVLDDDVAAAVRTHVDGCAECKAQYERLLLEDETNDPKSEHLPASLVFDWQNRLAEYGPVERELVRLHLGECSICRDGLLALGIEPVVADRSPDRIVLPATGTIHPEAEIVRMPKQRTSWSARERLFAGFGSLSTAIAVTLLVLRFTGSSAPPAIVVAPPPSPSTGSRPPEVTVPPPGTTAPPQSVEPTLAIAPIANELEPTVRGSATTVQRIALPASARTLRVRLEPLVGVDDATRVVVVLQAPGGRVLRVSTRQSELGRGAELRFTPPDGTPPAGRYTLRVEPIGADADSLAALDYEFEVRISSVR